MERLSATQRNRCESAVLRSHCVLVAMDQCTRRIVGFGVHRGVVDDVGLCRMFNRAVRGDTAPANFGSYRWPSHCRGLHQTPKAAQRARGRHLAQFRNPRCRTVVRPRVPSAVREAERAHGFGQNCGHASCF
jgi:hypothetical protein